MQTLDIKALNIQEKFMMIEQLWDSLKQDEVEQLTPKWHLDVLNHREDKTDFIELEEAKKNLKNMLKE